MPGVAGFFDDWDMLLEPGGPAVAASEVLKQEHNVAGVEGPK